MCRQALVDLKIKGRGDKLGGSRDRSLCVWLFGSKKALISRDTVVLRGWSSRRYRGYECLAKMGAEETRSIHDAPKQMTSALCTTGSNLPKLSWWDQL